MFKDKNENKKALEILEEQVAYFAKEKLQPVYYFPGT